MLINKYLRSKTVRNEPSHRELVQLAFSIPILLIVSGCNRSGKVETRIVEQIQGCPIFATCQISLRSVTDFDFDTMYVFDLTSNPQDRERVLGVKDDGFEEMERQLVFLRAGKIVHQENEPTNVEGVVKNQVVFDVTDGKSFGKYPRDARFSVIEEHSESRPYFVLKQMNDDRVRHP